MSVKTEFSDTLISLDDIDVIVVENQQTTITSVLLSKLALADITFIVTDHTYMPSALSIGLYKNSRTVKVQRAQIVLSKPKLNRLWQETIKQKIYHQAITLNYFDDDEYLYSLVNKVQSGDKTYTESIAAAYYFKNMFGKGFNRSDELDTRNAALNYGYSILRSSIARYIIAYGLNPTFGIWHSSELNPYNLADDFLEPCRPIVDRFVKGEITKESVMTPQLKQSLVSLLFTKVVSSDGSSVLLKDALKAMVASYQSVCLKKREALELFSLE